MVATWAAPLDSAVARCSEPCGAISGSSAAVAGLSNAPAIPSTKVAMKIWSTVSQPRIGAPGEEQRRQRLGELAELHDTLALDNDRRRVRRRTPAARSGRNCTSPTMPSIEGAAGEIVDLPADRHRSDLAGEARKAPRQQEEKKRALLEERAAGAAGIVEDMMNR